jgi:pimeloyl-ACP methyl ester carboxylesterase
MAHLTVNGARLWYEVRGSGEPIVLHHGYTASRVNWMPVVASLAQRYQVILVECRGTGESEHTADGYSLEQYAADVIGLADTLQLPRFTFAGHSMGGGVGYVLGLTYPERVQRLVLMAPVPADGFPNSDPRLHEQRRALRKSGDRAALLAQYRAGCVRSDVEDEAWFNSRIDHILGVSDGHYDGGAAAMAQLNVGARLSELTMPTLVLAGSADGLLTANIADFQRLPNAALHVFSRAGHDVALHEPDGVANAIDAFMCHGRAVPPG